MSERLLTLSPTATLAVLGVVVAVILTVIGLMMRDPGADKVERILLGAALATTLPLAGLGYWATMLATSTP